MGENYNANTWAIVFGILKTVGALLFSVVFMIESLIMALIPRKFRRRDIQGQVALITGGGSGLGRLVGLRLASRGAKIVTWDVNTEGNNETVRQIATEGGECHAYTVNLCDRNAIYKAAAAVKKDVGKVDILINNAGIVTGKNFRDSPDDLIQRTFDVNIMSHFWTTKSFLPDMMLSNKGHIVTIASMAGLIGINKLADYCSSKFAAVGFDESLRVEMAVEGYTGINTTVVCPYYINTGMFSGVRCKLMPILEQDFVADEIVDGILTKQTMVILPWYGSFLLVLKAVLPLKASMSLFNAMDGGEGMAEFKGHAPNEEKTEVPDLTRV